MPEFLTPLTPEDFNRRRSAKTARIDLEPYVNYNLSIRVGGAGDVKLSSGDEKPTIKRQIGLAATKVGKSAKYLRSSESDLPCQLSQA